MKKFLKITVVLISLVGVCGSAMADEELSNQWLQRSLNELEIVKLYVKKAKLQEPKHKRVVFNYRKLIRDINMIESGVERKLDRQKIQPNTIKPIKGDYIGVVGSNHG